MIKKFKNISFLVALCLALIYPGSAAAKALRVIYIQGYLSCSLGNYAPVHKFLEVAATHPDAKLYWGCFDAGHAQHLHDTTEHFYLYSINSQGQWSAGEELPAQTAPAEIAMRLRNDLNEIIEAQPTGTDSSSLMDIFVAGHSHGGWMALRTAYHISLMNRVDLQELLTIDPVSYELCASKWFPLHVVVNTVRWWGEPHECHRAPRDLEHIEPRIADAAKGRWTNIFETSMPYLSSGPIRFATKNLSYTAKTSFDWLTAHRAVLLDPSTWREFNNRLTEIASQTSSL